VPTACVRPACYWQGTGARADGDSAWEQKKLGAKLREMLDAKRAALEAPQRPAVRLREASCKSAHEV
jgi:hypothetical protein